MAPFVEFISQLAGILAEDSKFSPAEAEREAGRIEAENRQEMRSEVGSNQCPARQTNASSGQQDFFSCKDRVRNR